jgi:hypothetical protein
MTNMGRFDRYEALSKLTFISTPTVCPTARHAADLGIVPIIVEDAVGWGNEDAAKRSVAGLRYSGNAMFTTVAELTSLLRGR